MARAGGGEGGEEGARGMKPRRATCHRAETAALARRMAEARQRAKVPTVEQLRLWA